MIHPSSFSILVATGLLAFGLVASAPALSASAGESAGESAAGIRDPLATDRPSFSIGATTVAPGRLQTELGYGYVRERGASPRQTYAGPDVLLRLGVLETVELRIATAGYVVRDGGGDGFADVRVGSKIGLIEGRGWIPRLAVQPSLEIPVEDASTSDEVDPLLQIAASWSLGPYTGLLMNLNVGSTESPANGTEAVFAHSILISRALSPRLGVFAELFASYPTESAASQNLDFGATWLLTGDLQLDAVIGAGLDSDAPEVFTGAGISYRF